MFIATKLTSKCGDTAIFVLQESSKLISRKIWVIEKSWNFHTVPLAYLQKLIWGEQWKMEDFCNTRKCTIKIIVGFVLVMLTILLQKPWGTWFTSFISKVWRLQQFHCHWFYQKNSVNSRFFIKVKNLELKCTLLMYVFVYVNWFHEIFLFEKRESIFS